ncbi:MAG: Rrf2 family transcriptional regulator [Coriobacteriales bacterium]|jgi:Rrf2 family protein|nr:Rrf2 family transcriptional regulator [Coriobacteriales bacterium]
MVGKVLFKNRAGVEDVRITAKGRYALAALVEIASQTRAGDTVSVVGVADKLDISKIFLEQAISQLKKSDILHSTKGPKGGYQLTREPWSITVWDTLVAVENVLLEKADATVASAAPELEAALREQVWDRLDTVIHDCLASVSIQDLLDATEQQRGDQSFMLGL